MAISFREMPWYLQALVYATLAAVIIGLGEWLPFLPVQGERTQLATLNTDRQALTEQVSSLEVYRRRYSDFKAETEAMQKQLDTLQAIVPEEKSLDEFIRMVQGAAQASGVEIRHMTAGAVAPKEYHYEMPFDLEVDGPYYAMVDFFSRLSRLSRIINVGDLTLAGLKPGDKTKIPMRPATSVSGKLTLITFFTKPGEQAPPPPSAGKAPASSKPATVK
jgi:Tfp pilus assembly protein PilO